MQFVIVLLSILFNILVTITNTQDAPYSAQHFCHFDKIVKKNDSCPLNLDLLEEFSKSSAEWKIDIEVDYYFY
jgi:hypothetical protein